MARARRGLQQRGRTGQGRRPTLRVASAPTDEGRVRSRLDSWGALWRAPHTRPRVTARTALPRAGRRAPAGRAAARWDAGAAAVAPRTHTPRVGPREEPAAVRRSRSSPQRAVRVALQEPQNAWRDTVPCPPATGSGSSSGRGADAARAFEGPPVRVESPPRPSGFCIRCAPGRPARALPRAAPGPSAPRGPQEGLGADGLWLNRPPPPAGWLLHAAAGGQTVSAQGAVPRAAGGTEQSPPHRLGTGSSGSPVCPVLTQQ